MRRRTLAAVILVAAAGAAVAAQTSRRSYLVTVIPQGDGPVTNLTTSDFTVREEGAARDVILAQPLNFPLAVSLLIDMTQPQLGNSMVSRDLRTAVMSFVTALRASQKDVSIALVEVAAGAVTTADFDAPQGKLEFVAQRLLPAHPGDAVMLEAIGLAAERLEKFQTPRRAIVTIDFNSSESMSEGTMKRMTGALSRSGATVWSVSVRLPRAQGSRREGALNLITKNSGGLRLVVGVSTGLEEQLKKVADALGSQYMVDFSRPGDTPMKTVEIETKPGLKVHLTPMRR